ncbi:putative baseplate protein [Erwinia phage vB_EamM_TropicalSun]|uniref:Putative baseplate protein n=1 Tax=Erwinia phage vB_EamM_TropicalSun TaxID=2591372 RepID=A0A5B9NHZ4_9CAUD|nr:putative baseplate protein [Erwinia phage vB_EamM_TropicalSun]
MSANYNYVTDTGIISADTQDILLDVQAEWKSALGQNLDVDSSTPQGTLIQSEAVARASVMKTSAELANQINPNYSMGVFLDAICALLDISRGENKSTIGQGVIAKGDPNRVIPFGTRVSTSDGSVFTVLSNATIGNNRQVSITIVSTGFGPIELPVGQLNILDQVIGLASIEVTSQSTVVLGRVQLNDPQLKAKRELQLFNQGVGSTGAIQAKALTVNNVQSVKVVENNTGAPGVVNGIEFTLPSAMYVCVAGSANTQEVAEALYAAHGGGCPWDYGATGSGNPVNPPDGVTVIDPYSNMPYKVKFCTAILFDTYIKITVARGSSAASDVGVQNAIIAYANGDQSGEQGFVTGASVSAFEIAGAVCRVFPGAYVRSCLVAAVPEGSTIPPDSQFSLEVPMKPYQKAQTQLGFIIVTME